MKEQIDNIFENFDFEKVKKVMDFLKWEWAFKEGKYRIPEISDMRETAKMLLDMIEKDYSKNKDYYIVQTGGFCAECDVDGNIFLSFVLTEY